MRPQPIVHIPAFPSSKSSLHGETWEVVELERRTLGQLRIAGEGLRHAPPEAERGAPVVQSGQAKRKGPKRKGLADMWMTSKMDSAFQIHGSLFLLLLLLLFSFPLPSTCQTTQTSNSTHGDSTSIGSQTTPAAATATATPTPTATATVTVTATATATPTPTSLATTADGSGSSNSSQGAAGCGAGLEPKYRYLCDRRAAWGIVVESLASLGFVVSAGVLAGLLFWTLWACVSSHRRPAAGIGGTVASTSLFLLATAALFALAFAFVVRLTPRTCPARLFLFGVAFALAFACLLARCLALLGFAVARGCGEPCLALALFLVQAVIAAEWLIIVLARDGMACEYSQGEFVMLLIYVLCLLAAALVLSLRSLCRSCLTYSYSYTGGGGQRRSQVQATLLCLTLLLSTGIWVVWVALLTRGNAEMGHRPQWDDPVLSIALVANGWVLLLGHGLAQVVCLCMGETRSKDGPLDFGGWTSPSGPPPGQEDDRKEGRENGSFENDGEQWRGRGKDPVLRSPYESGFSMTEIDPDKDYSIPRPQTTNIREPYDEYYGHTLSD